MSSLSFSSFSTDFFALLFLNKVNNNGPIESLPFNKKKHTPFLFFMFRLYVQKKARGKNLFLSFFFFCMINCMQSIVIQRHKAPSFFVFFSFHYRRSTFLAPSFALVFFLFFTIDDRLSRQAEKSDQYCKLFFFLFKINRLPHEYRDLSTWVQNFQVLVQLYTIARRNNFLVETELDGVRKVIRKFPND